MKNNDTLYYRLVTACCAPHISPPACKLIRSLASEVKDWNALLETAKFYRAVPLLCNRFQQCGVADLPPPETVLSMQTSMMSAVAGHARRIHILAEVMHAFEQAEIPAITYKGPVLANEAYDTPSLRLFDDLDILVQKNRIREAKQLIERQSFQEILKLPGNIEKSPFRISSSYILRNEENGCTIDLNSRLTHNYFSFELPHKELWDSYAYAEIDGYRIRTLTDEALILYLCVHGSKHRWSRPIWIADIAGLLLHKEKFINWRNTLRLARSTDSLRMLLLGISLAAREYHIDIPAPLKTLMEADSALEALMDETNRYRINNIEKPETDDKERLMFHLRLRQQLTTRLRYITVRGITPSHNDWRTLALPRLLYPLYYLLRPFRLLFK